MRAGLKQGLGAYAGFMRRHAPWSGMAVLAVAIAGLLALAPGVIGDGIEAAAERVAIGWTRGLEAAHADSCTPPYRWRDSGCVLRAGAASTVLVPVPWKAIEAEVA